MPHQVKRIFVWVFWIFVIYAIFTSPDRAADLVITVGTSSVVYPAASLPEAAVQQGIPVIEVNPKPTPFSDQATVSLRETAATALPTLLQRLPELLPTIKQA